MTRVPKDLNAAERARWLAELYEALNEADRLASRLGLAHAPSHGAMELLMRLAAARAQVQALQLGRPDDPADRSDPKWTNAPLWPKTSVMER